jgi:hypothetical protein
MNDTRHSTIRLAAPWLAAFLSISTLIGVMPSRAHATPSMPSISGQSNVHRRGTARRYDIPYGPRYRIMLAGSAGYGFAAGDWFDGFSSGFTAGGALRLAVDRRFYLGFSYGRQWLGTEDWNESLCDDFGSGYECIPLDWDAHLDEYYFLIGFMSPVVNYTSPFAYFEMGFGGVDHSYVVSGATAYTNATESFDETEFGMLFALGGVFPLSKEIGFSVEGNVRITGGDSGCGSCDPYYGYYDYYGSSGSIWGMKAGIVVMFGE